MTELDAFLLLVHLLIGHALWSHRRRRWLLEQWAPENGFRLKEARLCPMRGPFRSGGYGTAYRMMLEDDRGATRKAWVLFSSALPADSDLMVVQWENRERSVYPVRPRRV